jgi:hypothetical protein
MSNKDSTCLQRYHNVNGPFTYAAEVKELRNMDGKRFESNPSMHLLAPAPRRNQKPEPGNAATATNLVV